MNKDTTLKYELGNIDADIKLLQERSYNLRKKLEDDSSSSSSRKGITKSVLSEVQKQALISKRRKTIMRKVRKTFLVLITCVLLSACRVTRHEPKYAVRSIEHLEKNAYKVTTDSFTVIKIVRGMAKYKPDSVTTWGYDLKPVKQ